MQIVISNGIYKVAVENDAAVGGGLYTIATDSGHPAGPNQNIFYRALVPPLGTTTYNTIRSYSTSTDYIQYANTTGLGTDLGFSIVAMSSASNTVQISPTSILTTYTLTTPLYHDNMTIAQYIAIHGTTFNDSTIEITTSVTNTGTSPLRIGIRYLWDYELDGDDGPTFQSLNPNGSVLTTEATFAPPTFQSYEMKNNTGTPLMTIKGTANGPGTLTPPPTPPDMLQYALWPAARSVVFSYNTTGLNADGDSAVLYYWGRQQNGIEINPRGIITVSASLFASACRGISLWDLR